MACNISTYALKLLKTGGGRYQGSAIISNPNEAARLIEDIFDMSAQPEEVFVMLTLNTKHRVTGAFEVSRGNLNSALVHPREVFKRALLNNSAGIIIAHNHPSGDVTPSHDDITTTQRLVEAGEILGINVLDHVILGGNDSISFRSQGLI